MHKCVQLKTFATTILMNTALINHPHHEQMVCMCPHIQGGNTKDDEEEERDEKEEDYNNDDVDDWGGSGGGPGGGNIKDNNGQGGIRHSNT